MAASVWPRFSRASLPSLRVKAVDVRVSGAWWWPAARHPGAVASAFGPHALEVGPEIDTGVPVLIRDGEPGWRLRSSRAISAAMISLQRAVADAERRSLLEPWRSNSFATRCAAGAHRCSRAASPQARRAISRQGSPTASSSRRPIPAWAFSNRRSCRSWTPTASSFRATRRPRKSRCTWRFTKRGRRRAASCISTRPMPRRSPALKIPTPTTPFRPITPYVVMRVGRVPLLPYTHPGSADVKPLVLAKARDHAAVLLANHGPVVSGRSFRDAVFAAEELEEAAKLAFLTQGLPVRRLDAEAVAELDQFRLK